MNTIHDQEKDDYITRILALPQREPVDCERIPGTRLWAPKTQALIEVVTAKYTRGSRLSCACRDRVVTATGGGRLTIFPQGREGQLPLPPIETDVDAFCRDAWHEKEEVLRAVQKLHPGQTITLRGLGYPQCLVEFNAIQAWGLREFPRAGGVLGMVSVGGGKTILGIMCPMTMPHLLKWVIFAKPDQRLHYKSAYLRLREHFRVPSMIFDEQRDLDGSWIINDPQIPTLNFIPYSTLSNKKNTTMLEWIDPDGVLADEVHSLANPTSSRTMRWQRTMSQRERVFGGWSGSTIKRKLRDVSHLTAFALGMGSPYPILPADVAAMSAVVDPGAVMDRRSKTAEALFAAFGNQQIKPENFATGFAADGGIREGHRDRVIRTPGIISTRSSDINCSISIRERKVEKVSSEVVTKLKLAREGTRPDGEELAEAMEIIEMTREVAAGFYSYWAYPKSTAEERSPGGLIDQWFAARKAWNKELRSKLLRGEPHLDSRTLCEHAAERAWREPRYDGDLPVWPAETWPAWAAIKDRVEPDPRVKWIDDYLARDAAKWAKENVGIVWVQSRAFGLKVAQLAGLPYHAGGDDAEAKILAEDGKRSAIASMKAHGEGRDGLQYKFCKQLFAETPPSGDRWEQILGRLARYGQEADTVETEVYRHLPEYVDAFASAVRLAQFIEAMTPNRQLLLAADVAFEI